MTKQTYLSIDDVKLPVKPDDYSVDLSDYVPDSGGTTEAGTTIRDVVREGIPAISVNFDVSLEWEMKLAAWKKKSSLQVQYFDPYTGALSVGTMYIDGFKAKLVHDTSYGGLWNVSFTLKDLEEE